MIRVRVLIESNGRKEEKKIKLERIRGEEVGKVDAQF